MANATTTEEIAEPSMHDGLSTWDAIRRIADELELKIHLAGMNARDRWHEIEPRLEKLEQELKDAGRRASQAVTDELEELWKALQGIRDDVNGN